MQWWRREEAIWEIVNCVGGIFDDDGNVIHCCGHTVPCKHQDKGAATWKGAASFLWRFHNGIA